MIANPTASMMPCRDLLAEFDEARERHAEAARNLREALVEAEVIEADRVRIELAGGGTAWVSLEDYPKVEGYRWYRTLNGPKAVAKKEYVFRWERRDSKERKVYLHRQIVHLKPGDDLKVDHVDGDTSNNTRGNLRVVTIGQNSMNRRKQGCYRGRATSSRYKGVSRSKGESLYLARIGVGGRRHFLGRFSDERDAALAYDARAKEFFGEFAMLNQYIYPELLTEGRAL